MFYVIKLLRLTFSVTKYEYSSKAITVEVWTGTGVSRRLRLPGFKTIGTRK